MRPAATETSKLLLPPEAQNVEINAEKLKQHVYMLAGEIGERNISRPDGLINSAHYISRQWEAMGYNVHAQGYRTKGVPCANLEITLKGTSRADNIILIGAHYDSIPGCPGANDNASGIALLIEMARVMRSIPTASTVRFVAFVNEEPPFFGTEDMGSWVYSHQAKTRGDDIEVALILETLGYFTDLPHSQLYPPFMRLTYPERGNFVAFISNLKSRKKLKQFSSSFNQHADMMGVNITAPQVLPGISWGDHSPFWLNGYKAVMVTDTGPYRYPFFHSSKDTPERLNYAYMAQVGKGLVHSVMATAGT